MLVALYDILGKRKIELVAGGEYTVHPDITASLASQVEVNHGAHHLCLCCKACLVSLRNRRFLHLLDDEVTVTDRGKAAVQTTIVGVLDKTTSLTRTVGTAVHHVVGESLVPGREPFVKAERIAIVSDDECINSTLCLPNSCFRIAFCWLGVEEIAAALKAEGSHQQNWQYMFMFHNEYAF